MRRILLLLVLALAGCGGGSGRAPCPAGQRCLEYGNSNEPETLDPHTATGTYESRILAELFTGLTQDDPLGRPIPGVATRWEVSADGLHWRFHLRPSLWSDGSPLTAADFVYALRRALDPRTGSPSASLLYVLANGQAINEGRLAPNRLGARAPDPLTLDLTLVHPAPYLLELAKHQIMMPLPAHAITGAGEGWTQPGKLVSNGPYVLAAWRLGDRLTLVRNRHFDDGGKKLCFDRIHVYPTTDGIAAERRIRSGELDINTEYQSSRVDYLRTALPGTVRAAPMLSPVYLVFNLAHPALGDRRVRRALSMAIDRDFITGKLLRGVPPPAVTFVPPGTAGAAAPPRIDWAGWPLARRQREARRLLAAAGYGPGHPLAFELTYRTQRDPTTFVPAIQADWRAIGVDATLVGAETQIAYASYRLGDFDVADAAANADYNDPMSFVAQFESKAGQQNYGGYRNPRFDALLAQAERTADGAARAALIAAAEQILLDDAAIAPLYFSVSRNLVSPGITGWTDNIANQHRARYLCGTAP